MPEKAKKDILIISLVFTVSRLIIFWLWPFWYTTINWYMHYLDPVILKNNLYSGLMSLHTQPPLLNAFIGLLLKISPSSHETGVFAFAFFILGWFIVVGSYLLMRHLGVVRKIALSLSVLIMLLPSMVQAQRWLFYPYPTAFLLIGCAFMLYKYFATLKLKYGASFFLFLAALVLTKSLYHIILWMLPVMAFMLWLNYKHFKKTFALASVFAIICLSMSGFWYVKNQVQFGIFTSSTFQGLNIWAMTKYVPQSDIQSLYDQHKVTALVFIPRFAAPGTYYNYYHMLPATGNLALYGEVNSTGNTNWNNIIYAKAGQEYQKNAIAIISRHPFYYLEAVANEAYLFFGLKPYRYFNEFAAWGIPHGSKASEMLTVALVYLVPLIIVFAFFAGAWALLNRIIALRPKTAPEPKQVAIFATLVFILFTMLYVFALASAAELGEGCYMRIAIDPFIIIGLALFLENLRTSDIKYLKKLYICLKFQ